MFYYYFIINVRTWSAVFIGCEYFVLRRVVGLVVGRLSFLIGRSPTRTLLVVSQSSNVICLVVSASNHCSRMHLGHYWCNISWRMLVVSQMKYMVTVQPV